MVAILICNLGHWHLCYPPLVGKLKKMIPGVIMTKRITLQRHLLSLPQHVVYSINKYARYIVSAKLNVVVGIIEPDIPRHIKIKRSCLTSSGTVRDMEFDLIYVNGDNNLENIRRPDET